MSSHHCPHILGNGRAGFWFSCRCGVNGAAFRSPAGRVA
jgi:hypothetical protein